MPTYKLKVIKRPLSEPIPDIQPNFPKLDNLHLELIENKKKIRPGLPLIPIRRNVVKPATSPIPKPAEVPSGAQPSPVRPPPDAPKDTPRGAQPSPVQQDQQKIEDDLIRELGIGSEPEESPMPEPSAPQEMPREAPHQEAPEEEHVEEEVPQEEQEEEDRQEYLVRFKILKKKHPKYEFPHYTEHTDFHTLKRLYKDALKMITLEENVDSYRVWLMAGFLGIELLAVKAGLDFKGFSKFQFKKMEKYEKMLVELGEKSYSNFAANWPVEVRLLGVIILDAGIFYLGKLVADYAGEGVADIFGMLFGMPPAGRSSKEKKRKMRGPTTKPDDIRNMNKAD